MRPCKLNDFEKDFSGSIKKFAVDRGLGICPENSSALYVNSTEPGEIFYQDLRLSIQLCNPNKVKCAPDEEIEKFVNETEIFIWQARYSIDLTDFKRDIPYRTIPNILT